MTDYNPDYDVKGNLQRLGYVMQALATVDLEGFLAVVEMAHTMGPFIDPTLYRDGLYRGDMDAMADLVRELLPGVRVWNEKIAPKLAVPA